MLRFLLATAAVCAVAYPVVADDPPTYELVLKNHEFFPAEIHVGAGKPFYVLVKNESGAGDEFEMLLPPVERGLPAGGQGRVRIRPLGQGRFPFFGESDPDNEKGVFVSE